MIKSMTGYGRSQMMILGRDITVEIKSVNHRYFELNTKTTRGYAFLEEKVKSYLKERIYRGKVDIYIGIEALEGTAAEVKVNHSLAQGYITALNDLAETYGLKNDISVVTLSRYPDVLAVHKAQDDEDEIWNSVEQVLSQAVESFISMRMSEGNRLKEDIIARSKTIMEYVAIIEERSPQTVKEYKEKLQLRLNELIADVKIDEQRILTEAAIFADKIAVDEETVRLRSHFTEMEKVINSGDAVGRKLDFIVQEMNREANTIGSKSQDSRIAYTVVDIKAEIEKIREQIQNIE